MKSRTPTAKPYEAMGGDVIDFYTPLSQRQRNDFMRALQFGSICRPGMAFQPFVAISLLIL